MKNFLKEYRTKTNLTQKQVATLCEISERQYIRYEVSYQVPTVNIALRLARVLGTTVEELFPLEGEDDK